MIPDAFRTATGRTMPAVTAAEMNEVDRIAVDEIGLDLLQMMENAGRNLARHVRSHGPERVSVVAGNGGNGGGGLACARHLANRGIEVTVVLDRPAADLSGAAASQFRVLAATDVPVSESDVADIDADVVVDALIGYGLTGSIRGPAEELIRAINDGQETVVSLDVPSGIDATSGETLGVAVEANSTVTLALPKTGLVASDTPVVLGDIAVPAVVYERAGIDYESPFDDYLVPVDQVGRADHSGQDDLDDEHE